MKDTSGTRVQEEFVSKRNLMNSAKAPVVGQLGEYGVGLTFQLSVSLIGYNSQYVFGVPSNLKA